MRTCTNCGKKLGFLEKLDGECSECQVSHVEQMLAQDADRIAAEEMGRKLEAEASKLREDALQKLLITTETAHNLEISARFGVVTGQCAFGLNLIKDVFTGVRDLVGGRSNVIEKAIKDATEQALSELSNSAIEMGADAVVGVSFTHTQMSSGPGNMIAVVAAGTAVKLA